MRRHWPDAQQGIHAVAVARKIHFTVRPIVLHGTTSRTTPQKNGLTVRLIGPWTPKLKISRYDQSDTSRSLPQPHAAKRKADNAKGARDSVPTARVPERGLRENEDHEPRRCHGVCVAGSGWPPIKGSPRYTVLQCAPSMPLNSPATGRGRSRKAEYCLGKDERAVGVQHLSRGILRSIKRSHSRCQMILSRSQ